MASARIHRYLDESMTRHHFLYLVLGLVLLGVATISTNQMLSEPSPPTHVIESGEAPPFAYRTVRA